MLEIGGSSLPRALVLEVLGSKQWVCVDILEHDSGRYQLDAQREHYAGIDILSLSPQSQIPESAYVVFDGSAECIPKSFESQFDLVFSVNSFEHILPLDKVVGRLHRSLRSNGALFSQFGPVWSCPEGSHFWVTSSLNFVQPGPVRPWAHLLLTRAQLEEELKDAGIELELIKQIIYQVYDSNFINRRFYEDYQQIMAASAFADYTVEPMFSREVPTNIQRELEDLYPGHRDFGAYCIRIVARVRQGGSPCRYQHGNCDFNRVITDVASDASLAIGGKCTKLIGADIPLDTSKFPIVQLLEAFRILAVQRSDVTLLLAGRRNANETFSVLNFLEREGIADRVHFYPYFDVCRDFPVKKEECDLWIERTVPAQLLTAQYLAEGLDNPPRKRVKNALFVTSFHPMKMEGNSTLMRRWLADLQARGYQTHVAYYLLDIANVSEEMRERGRQDYSLYLEVEVTTPLVNHNKNGLNVHVDDWCGPEFVSAILELVQRYEYDIAIVNYPFMSATFEVMPSYTRKVLFMHDSFADRNRRMLAQGYPESGWVSLAEAGERLACLRSDVVVALQEEEAGYFERLVGQKVPVQVVSPVITAHQRLPRQPSGAIRIGYLGSSNWVNELNYGEFVKAWLDIPYLRNSTKLVLAGGVCRTIDGLVPDTLLAEADLERIGPVDDLKTFFESCDIVINPERGGTGIKIKTLEAMSCGVPFISTAAGTVGIGSMYRFHTAADAADLARLIAEIALDPALIEEVRRETVDAYAAYVARNQAAMDQLLGPLVNLSSVEL